MSSPPDDTAPQGGVVNALVLAGSRRGEADAVARAAGVSRKAFAPAGGRPMIERVVGVLLEHPRIGRVDVALDHEALGAGEAPRLAHWLEQGRVAIAAPAASPARTVARVLPDRSTERALLVTTADHALLSAAMIDRFLDNSEAPDIDVFAALLPLAVLEASYPEMTRTGLKLRDGRYSGCNLFKLRPGPGARSIVSFWTRMEASRKTPWRMAMIVGPRALLAYGLRRITLAQAADTIGLRAGGRLAPVILDIPEAAIDVDTPRDLAFVERLLQHG